MYENIATRYTKGSRVVDVYNHPDFIEDILHMGTAETESFCAKPFDTKVSFTSEDFQDMEVCTACTFHLLSLLSDSPEELDRMCKKVEI